MNIDKIVDSCKKIAYVSLAALPFYLSGCVDPAKREPNPERPVYEQHNRIQNGRAIYTKSRNFK